LHHSWTTATAALIVLHDAFPITAYELLWISASTLSTKSSKTVCLFRGYERTTSGWTELACVQCDSFGAHWLEPSTSPLFLPVIMEYLRAG
jgi:hypothetical protein